jgi:hypothetical protein
MPIIALPQGKKLKDKNIDPEVLGVTMGVDVVAENVRHHLRKVARDGSTLYVWVSPYSVEIGPCPTLYGGWDREAELNSYHQS